MADRKSRKRPKRQRTRTVRVGLVNVRAHPHDDGAATYVKLWQAAAKDAYNVPFHRDKRVVIGSSNLIEQGVLAGEIWIYTLIGAKDVLDLSTGRLLDPEEFQKIAFGGLDVKKHGFNAHTIPYVFLTDGHRVAIELRRGLSPKFLKFILERALNREAVLAAAGAETVQVDVEQETKKLDEIFSLKLQSLEVVVRPPNSDDLDDIEEEVERSLRNQNASEQRTELKAEPGKDLKPDLETRKLAAVALSHGFVTGRGRDPQHNHMTAITTLDAPLIAVDTFDPNVDNFLSFLVRLAKRGLASIKALRRKPVK